MLFLFIITYFIAYLLILVFLWIKADWRHRFLLIFHTSPEGLAWVTGAVHKSCFFLFFFFYYIITFYFFIFFIFFVFEFYFIFKLYITVLVLPNIKMNPPQVYLCSPSWTPLFPDGHCCIPRRQGSGKTRIFHDYTKIFVNKIIWVRTFLDMIFRQKSCLKRWIQEVFWGKEGYACLEILFFRIHKL